MFFYCLWLGLLRVFSKYYVRRIYRDKTLPQLLSTLDSWVDKSLQTRSKLLLQTTGYILWPVGGVFAPFSLRDIVIKEILRLNDYEDLRSSLILSIIEAYREFIPDHGTDIVNWLARRVPYLFSKVITWRIFHGIDENFSYSIDFSIDFRVDDVRVDLISEQLGLSPQLKRYYKLGGINATPNYE